MEFNFIERIDTRTIDLRLRRRRKVVQKVDLVPDKKDYTDSPEKKETYLTNFEFYA